MTITKRIPWNCVNRLVKKFFIHRNYTNSGTILGKKGIIFQIFSLECNLFELCKIVLIEWANGFELYYCHTQLHSTKVGIRFISCVKSFISKVRFNDKLTRIVWRLNICQCTRSFNINFSCTCSSCFVYIFISNAWCNDNYKQWNHSNLISLFR